MYPFSKAEINVFGFDPNLGLYCSGSGCNRRCAALVRLSDYCSSIDFGAGAGGLGVLLRREISDRQAAGCGEKFSRGSGGKCDPFCCFIHPQEEQLIDRYLIVMAH